MELRPLSDHPDQILPRLYKPTAYILLCGLVLLYGLFLSPRTGQREDKDFTHLWLAGRMIVVGQARELYNPQIQVMVYSMVDPQATEPPAWNERYRLLGCLNYPPPAAVYYSMLAWMPLQLASIVNAYATLVLTLVVAFVFARALEPPVAWAVPGIALLLYYPYFANFALGQNAVLTAALLVGSWYCFKHNEDLWAGFLIGILIVKPNWLFAVGWIPLVHGRWRAVLGIISGAMFTCLSSMIITGPGPFVDYVDQLLLVSRLHELPGYQLDLKFSALGMFRKWFGVSRTADLAGWTSAVMVVLITLLSTCRRWRVQGGGLDRVLTCSLLAALWINPHLNHYDLTLMALLILPLVMHLHPQGKQWVPVCLWIIVIYAVTILDHYVASLRVLSLPSLVLLMTWAWSVVACLRYHPAALPEEATDETAVIHEHAPS